jgi:ribonuclease HI/probable phosphoglycerate mutase
MSMSPDGSKVLKELARTLDVSDTLKNFPDIDSQKLSEILFEASCIMEKSTTKPVIMIDGAARGNPGPASAAAILNHPDVKRGVYIGEATNNVAEYKALILVLELAAEMGLEEIEIQSDSELLVKQMTGVYRVKNPGLQDLFIKAQRAAARLSAVSYRHIPREENVEADRIANMALDAKGKVSL